jgi:hypothetical protein
MKSPMSLIVRISRSDNQWIAEIPRATGFVAWSPSLARLRTLIDKGLREFYPSLTRYEQEVVFDLPAPARALIRKVKRAEHEANSARTRATTMKRQASRRLRATFGISIREVAALLGVSGSRAQQLLRP